ncbi:MAG: hypothetical protein IKU21_07480 [Anaerotignum sp.]|nr:hypothetical protein [Anaerotignum sp.]
MFCEEKIIAAYRGRREYDNIDGANDFFDCYHDLAYHVTEGYRIVLETENYYISLGISGAELCEKTGDIEEFEQAGEWLDSYIHIIDPEDVPWVDYEATLFVGERLLKVEEKDRFYLLHFDDFQLKLIPHALNEDDFPCLCNKDPWSYNYVLGVERLITEKCVCGGEGELLMDFVSDYLVRCKKCKKSTWAQMNVQDAIEEWNGGFLNCDTSDVTIE